MGKIHLILNNRNKKGNTFQATTKTKQKKKKEEDEQHKIKNMKQKTK